MKSKFHVAVTAAAVILGVLLLWTWLIPCALQTDAPDQAIAAVDIPTTNADAKPLLQRFLPAKRKPKVIHD